jgi:hypothetical protein
VFEFIEGRYNPRRCHPSLGYDSPVDYDEKYFATVTHATQTLGLSNATLPTETG